MKSVYFDRSFSSATPQFIFSLQHSHTHQIFLGDLVPGHGLPLKELLVNELQDDLQNLPEADNLLLDPNSFMRIIDAVCENFSTQYLTRWKLTRNEFSMEDKMTDIHFLKFLINDIVSTNEYTLEGMAHTDAVREIVSGMSESPSLMFTAKVVKSPNKI